MSSRVTSGSRSVLSTLNPQMRKTSTLSKINPEVRVKKTSYLIAKTLFASLFIAAIVFAGCKKDDFEGEIVGVCPVVTTDPADKAVNVVINKVITATFNTNMDPETINASSFIIKQGTQEIEGTVAPTADAAVYTFTPKVALSPFTTYTGTITKASRDVLHTAMVEDYVWTFTTIPLISLSASPVAGGTTAGEGFIAQDSVAAITATPNTGYTFTSWTENGTVVSTSPSLTFAMDGNKSLVANFTPVVIGRFAVVLSSNPAIGGSTLGSGSYETGSVVTIAAVANFGYSFVNWTGDERGTTSSLSFTIGSNKNIVANFKLDPTNTTPVPPITTNPPTTPTQPPVGTAPKGPANINLGSAGDFTILTKAGISTTGVTSVGGDIGVSPAAATSITGFGLIMDSNNQSSHTPAVTGKVYAADYAAPTPAKMTTAVKDMETAFTTANGLTTPAPIVGLYSGNISGRVLAPGLYKWASGVLITNAGVTLAGGPNDTWVFQISQDLTVNSSAIVTLIGGAQAKNITWVVSGQATLGTNANFSGTILSKTLISLNTGTVVKGRLLAQTAVTLNASTVTKP